MDSDLRSVTKGPKTTHFPLVHCKTYGLTQQSFRLDTFVFQSRPHNHTKEKLSNNHTKEKLSHNHTKEKLSNNHTKEKLLKYSFLYLKAGRFITALFTRVST